MSCFGLRVWIDCYLFLCFEVACGDILLAVVCGLLVSGWFVVICCLGTWLLV